MWLQFLGSSLCNTITYSSESSLSCGINTLISHTSSLISFSSDLPQISFFCYTADLFKLYFLLTYSSYKIISAGRHYKLEVKRTNK